MSKELIPAGYIRGIACLFQGSDKPYTYKTVDKSIKPGDYVIVESNKPSDRVLHNIPDREGRPLNILSVLEVVAVDVPFETGIKYKPIIQKINFEDYLILTGEL